MKPGILICFLLIAVAIKSATAECPPKEEDIKKVAQPMKAKFDKDVCGQGIKPGGAADVAFVKQKILPKYLSAAFIGKAPPVSLHDNSLSLSLPFLLITN